MICQMVLQKGVVATEAWNEARKRTTPAGFGGMVYSKLLKYVPAFQGSGQLSSILPANLPLITLPQRPSPLPPQPIPTLTLGSFT